LKRVNFAVIFVVTAPSLKTPRANAASGGGDTQRGWRVIAGDRMDTIAFAVYGDATRWRAIAEYNQLDNPLTLKSGRQLIIPMD
ncbi:MAG: LysM peptidoglycan-binding domain-containing protein, partial [Anaerolineae bacterium]|nr:LysM peptidoglycan-binding domain-containing protein [Anaerolineae bacterium]